MSKYGSQAYLIQLSSRTQTLQNALKPKLSADALSAQRRHSVYIYIYIFDRGVCSAERLRFLSFCRSVRSAQRVH